MGPYEMITACDKGQYCCIFMGSKVAVPSVLFCSISVWNFLQEFSVCPSHDLCLSGFVEPMLCTTLMAQSYGVHY